MGTSQKDSGGGEAAMARAEEDQRQKEIREGTERINDIFDGSLTGTGALTAGAQFDPNATYYLADGTVWAPAGGGGGGAPVATPATNFSGREMPGAPAESAAPRNFLQGVRDGSITLQDGQWGPVGGGKSPAEQFAEMLASGKLFSGTASSGGFGDDFFNSRRQAYLDYATPQLDQQYADAQRELTYALTRNGTLDSSMRADKASELQKLYDINRQKVGDQALAYETDARNAVEGARSDLISTLNATGDVKSAVNSALARSTALSKPPAYSPLTSMFVDFTNALGTKAAADKANYYSSGVSGGTGASLFNNTSNAVKVT